TSNQLILCVNIPKMSVNRGGAAVCPVKDHSNRLPAVGFLQATYTKRSHVGEIVVTLFLYGSGPLVANRRSHLHEVNRVIMLCSHSAVATPSLVSILNLWCFTSSRRCSVY